MIYLIGQYFGNLAGVLHIVVEFMCKACCPVPGSFQR